MMVWDIPENEIADAGRRAAALPWVSHCYERERRRDFPGNLYAMIHARGEQELATQAASITACVGRDPVKLLRTLRELKRSSPALAL